MLDPDIQILLDTVMKASDADDPPDLAQVRMADIETPLKLGGIAEPLESVHDNTVFGPGGLIPIRVYRPESPHLRPLFVYAHGGGWVAGSLDSHDKLCRALANRLGAVVVAVDYRLSPEHDFPQALDDVDAIWRWAQAHARTLGADAQTFAVAGDSSGGNLAAALCLRLRARQELQPALQLLMYPALDAGCSSASYDAFASGYGLSAAHMRWYWQRYHAPEGVDAAERSPLTAGDSHGLAPAVIAIAEYDVLRDDGTAYANRFAEAGVPVEIVRCDGMAHGFLRWGGAVPAAMRWLDTIAAASRGMLARRA